MIVQQHGKALGTAVVFTLNTPGEQTGRLVLVKIQHFLHDFENRFSRFLVGSELTRHNQHAGEWSKATPEFTAFSKVSNEMQDWSEGLYNPFVLPDLQRSGYVGSMVGSHGREAAVDMRGREANYSEARIGIQDGSVMVPAGTAFDSGGLGKGYALDMLADLVEAEGINDYWISLGGDIIGRGVDETNTPWRVTLEMIDGEPVVTLATDARTAVATSSTLKRRGEGWHHLIDPRTGTPSTSAINTVSVVAESGVKADVLAKCLLLSDKDAKSFWQRHEAHEVYIQTNE